MKKLLISLVLTLGVFGDAVLGTTSGTPVGTLGGVIDLRSFLPVEIRKVVPKDDKGIRHQKTIDVGTPPIKVDVVWVSFKHSTGTYLLSYRANVAQASSGVFLTAPTHDDPVNLGTKNLIVESTKLNFAWSRNTLTQKTFGTVVLRIGSDGKSQLF